MTDMTQAPTPGPLSVGDRVIAIADLRQVPNGAVWIKEGEEAVIVREFGVSNCLVGVLTDEGHEGEWGKTCFRLAPTAPVEASGSEREADGDLLRATEALSAVVIADKHRPIGGVTSADWIRNVQKPAIDFAEKVLTDIRPQLIRSERATEHHQGSGLRASVGDHEAQAHSELEPDDRTCPLVDQEGRRSREARRGDAVCASGVERSECALGADEPQEVSVGPAVNAAGLRPQPSGETREQVALIIRQSGIDRGWAQAGDAEKLADRIFALIRPAPVASGGQHSSGPDEPTEEMIQAALKVDLGAEDERWTVINLWQTMKAAAPVAETAGEADPIAYVSRSALKEWLESEHTMADLELRLFEIGDVVPLYAAPVPAQDDDKLRIEKASVIRDRLRQIWEGDTHLVYSGNPPEPSHDEEGPLALLANEAVEALNSIFPVPDDFAALKSTAAQEGGE